MTRDGPTHKLVHDRVAYEGGPARNEWVRWLHLKCPDCGCERVIYTRVRPRGLTNPHDNPKV